MIIPRKYRKKPVVIEAILWDGSAAAALLVSVWAGQANLQNDDLILPTLEGMMRVSKGDYIIKGIKGEVYPCKPDIFEQTYDPC